MTDHDVDLVLMAARLGAALEAGERPPCCWPDLGPLWLSEDREERAEAALHCDGCVIWSACRDAGESAGRTGGRASFGVWAGHDYGNGPRPTTTSNDRPPCTYRPAAAELPPTPIRCQPQPASDAALSGGTS